MGSRKPCAFAGCSNPHLAKGYCCAHYDQLYRGSGILRPVRHRRWRNAPRNVTDDDVLECQKCRERLPAHQFNYSSHATTGRAPHCRICERFQKIKHMLGVTRHEWQALFAAQGGRCALCGAEKPGGNGYQFWHTDHDHACCPVTRACGRCIRGILCIDCNCRAVPGYERLPPHLRTWPEMNAYLNRRPISAMRTREVSA